MTPQTVASMLHDAFVQQKAKAGITYSKTLGDLKGTWMSLANKVSAAGVEPYKFMSSQFSRLEYNAKVTVTPSQLVQGWNRCLERCNEAGLSVAEVDYEKVYAAQINRLNTIRTLRVPSWYHDSAEILADPNQAFLPWFRCWAVPDDRLVQRWGELAMQELSCSKKLSEFVEKAHETGRLPGFNIFARV